MQKLVEGWGKGRHVVKRIYCTEDGRKVGEGSAVNLEEDDE